MNNTQEKPKPEIEPIPPTPPTIHPQPEIVPPPQQPEPSPVLPENPPSPEPTTWPGK